TPEINARRAKGGAPSAAEMNAAGSALGNSLLDQAREVLQSLQDEEQIVLNQRMHDQEWATQSAQILDFLPKLDRSVVEMEKEKRGYLLTGENNFIEAYKRAVAATHIRSVIDNILDGMITVDENGAIRSMNPAAEEMFGCRDNEMIGHNFTRLVPKRYEAEHDAKPVVCNWTEISRRTGTSML